MTRSASVWLIWRMRKGEIPGSSGSATVLAAHRTCDRWIAGGGVDTARSQIKNRDGDLAMDSSIEGFEVDVAKTNGLGMFRLEENSMTVVVHERIKKAIEQAGINTFAFVDTKDWTQL